MDSIRGVAAVVGFFRNSSRNSSCDAIVRSGRETITFFCCFECNSLFAMVSVERCSKHVSSVGTPASIAVAPIADFRSFHPFSKRLRSDLKANFSGLPDNDLKATHKRL